METLPERPSVNVVNNVTQHNIVVPSLITELLVGETKLRLLLDPGSNIDALSSKFYKKNQGLFSSDPTTLQSTDLVVNYPNGTTDTTTHLVKANLNIPNLNGKGMPISGMAGYVPDCSFNVVKLPPNVDGILGMPFSTRCDLLPKFKDRKAYLDRSSVITT